MQIACSMALRLLTSSIRRDTNATRSGPSPSSCLAVSTCFSCEHQHHQQQQQQQRQHRQRRHRQHRQQQHKTTASEYVYVCQASSQLSTRLQQYGVCFVLPPFSAVASFNTGKRLLPAAHIAASCCTHPPAAHSPQLPCVAHCQHHQAAASRQESQHNLSSKGFSPLSA